MTQCVQEMFNGALLAMSVAAIDQLQLFEELGSQPLHIEGFCRDHNLHQPSLIAILRGLHKAGVVELDEARGVAMPGREFAEALANKGYFRWLIGGYGDMLVNMGRLVRNGSRTGAFVQRNGQQIAAAASDYGAQFVDRHFYRVLERMPFSVVADLGCGEATRLVSLATQRPGLRGIGLELDDAVVQRANALIARHEFTSRLQVVRDDVKCLDRRPEYEQADVLFSFFMGHDLWPRADCLQALRRIRSAFPNATRFLLADTYRSELREDQELPIFTLGFEITHALMGQMIPTLTDWLKLFDESEWLCIGHYPLGIAHSCVFDLRRRS